MSLSKSKYTIPKVNRKLYQPPKQRIARVGPETKLRRPLVYQDHYALENAASGRRIRMIVISIAVLLSAQSILHVPFLQLRSVDITGLRYLPADTVQAAISKDLSRRRWFLFRNDNFFIFSETGLTEALEKRFLVKVVTIETRFPQTLSIELVERIAPFVVQTPEKYLQLDTSGIALGDSPGPQPGQNVIADERAAWGTAIPQAYLELATSIKNLWEKTVPEVIIAKFHLTDEEDRLTVSTDAGFKVYFDRTKDVEKQINRLAVLLQNRSLEAPAEYVDLRFDETLFVR